MSIQAPEETAGLAPETLAALTAGLLLIDDARIYGLITGGPSIDREQCVAVLERLAADGVVASHEQAVCKAIEIMAELSAVTSGDGPER